jgi:hypothetical protein
MTPDTAAPALSDPGSFNKYAYAGGDPINRIDRNGRSWADIYCFAESIWCGTQGAVGDYLGDYIGAAYGILSYYQRLGEQYNASMSLLQPLRDEGLIDSYEVDYFSGGARLSFGPETAGIAIPICIAQPELCVAGGVLISIYVIGKALPELIRAIESRRTARDLAPITFGKYNTGRDENGNCKPPDPGKNVWWKGSDPSHVHWYEWNVNPETCDAYPDWKTGPKAPDGYEEVARI